MNEKAYNGWSNYETWVTNLWLTNDESTYSQCRDLAEAAFAAARPSATLTRGERYRRDFADARKELVSAEHPLQDSPGLYSDLLTGAMREINWLEIASSMFEEFDEASIES